MKRSPLVLGVLFSLALAACGGGGAAAPASSAAGSPAAAPGSAAPAASKPAASSPAASAGAASASAASAPGASAKPSASTAASASSKPAASGLTTLKIAHVPSTLFSPLYIAIDKGYMKQEGIQADLTVVAAGQDAMAFLANGQLDAAVAGISAGTFNAIDKGLDVRVVSSMGTSPQKGDPSALMVRTDELKSGAIKTPADLKGKKIASTGGLGATGSYYLAEILAKGNLTLKDVDVEPLNFQEMVVGFKNKSIDAAIPSAPYTTEILKEDSAEIPDFGHLPSGVSGTGTIYGQHLLTQDSALGKKLMTALVMGSRDLQGGKASDPANIAILAKYTKLPVDTLNGMALYDFRPDLAPDTATYENMQKVFIQAGILKLPQPLPIAKIADDSFSKAAAAAVK